MAENMEEIVALRTRVFESEAAMWLLEMDPWLGLELDAHAAWRSRLAKALWCKEDLLHALRGEGLTIEQAEELARQDRANFDALIAEDEAREARERRARNRDFEEEAA